MNEMGQLNPAGDPREPETPPMISVVVPCFNNGASILPTLQALANQQGCPPFEVILADDGSTDQTAELARNSGLARVFVFEHAGPAGARNQGAEQARGQILVFTDSDCIPEPGWLASLTEPILKGRAQAVKGRYRTRQTTWVARLVQVEFEERYRMLAECQSIDFVDTYSMALDTRLFRSVGGFDCTFTRPDNEDVDLSYRLAQAGARMVYVDQAAVYHTHPASLCRYLKTKFGRGFWRMKVYRNHPSKALKDSYTPQGLKLQCLLAMAMLACLPLLLIRRALGLRLLGWLAGMFLTSTLPLIKVAKKKDPGVAPLVPLFSLGRAFSLGLGALAGVARWISARDGRS